MDVLSQGAAREPIPIGQCASQRCQDLTLARAWGLLVRIAGDLDALDVGRRQAEDFPQLLHGVRRRHGVDARQRVLVTRANRWIPYAASCHSVRVKPDTAAGVRIFCRQPQMSCTTLSHGKHPQEDASQHCGHPSSGQA